MSIDNQLSTKCLTPPNEFNDEAQVRNVDLSKQHITLATMRTIGNIPESEIKSLETFTCFTISIFKPIAIF